MIKKFLPKTLLGRSTLILLIPLIGLQIIVTLIFYNRHWDTITRHRTINFAGDIALLVESFEKFDSLENQKWVLNNASSKLQIASKFKLEEKIDILKYPENPSLVEKHLIDALLPLKKLFLVNINDKKKLIKVLVQTENGVLEFTTNKKRIYSSTTYIFILWMLSASLILFIVALIFLRNQIKPIRRLAIAVDRFGKGRDVKDFKPSGAKEVRRAAFAFQTMKERIENSISQRNRMFSSISHDIRTILTRMKLELEFIPTKKKGGLEKDVNEMKEMVGEYLNYAKGEKKEKTKKINIIKIINSILKRYSKKKIFFSKKENIYIFIKSNSFKRCIDNILSNSLKFANKINISYKKKMNHVVLTIDDDGPGIPQNEREKVLMPFYRIENSRNRATGGVGLGMTIALDIIHTHGGNLYLDNSPEKGLRVNISLPL